MSSMEFGAFLVVIFLGSYFQAVTGFALGIVLMGYVALAGPIPLALAASLLTVLGLVNTIASLGRSGWGHINWTFLWQVTLGVIPGTIIGLMLLNHLEASHAASLQLILGLTIIFAAISLIMKPHPYDRPSQGCSFFLSGSIGGVLGGLFGVPGPPLIYHLYRQPVPINSVRTTLLLVFGLLCLFRLGLEVIQGSFDTQVLQLGLLSIPTTAVAGWLYVRFPPAISDTTMRRGSFILFGAMGIVIFLIAARSIDINFI